MVLQPIKLHPLDPIRIASPEWLTFYHRAPDSSSSKHVRMTEGGTRVQITRAYDNKVLHRDWLRRWRVAEAIDALDTQCAQEKPRRQHWAHQPYNKKKNLTKKGLEIDGQKPCHINMKKCSDVQQDNASRLVTASARSTGDRCS